MQRYTICVGCTIRHYAEPFHAMLHCLYVPCTIRHYAKPFHTTLHCLYVRCTIRHNAKPFHATLHRLCVRCATRHYPEPFDATLHRLCTVLQMSAKLFAIELVHCTISCSNSTWATRPFLIWLNYSCLGCSVSERKTRPSIIWLCHSFISYAILQLILTPSFYSLIYLTSLYFLVVTAAHIHGFGFLISSRTSRSKLQNVNKILLGAFLDATDAFSDASIVYYSSKRSCHQHF